MVIVTMFGKNTLDDINLIVYKRYYDLMEVSLWKSFGDRSSNDEFQEQSAQSARIDVDCDFIGDPDRSAKPSQRCDDQEESSGSL